MRYFSFILMVLGCFSEYQDTNDFGVISVTVDPPSCDDQISTGRTITVVAYRPEEYDIRYTIEQYEGGTYKASNYTGIFTKCPTGAYHVLAELLDENNEVLDTDDTFEAIVPVQPKPLQIVLITTTPSCQIPVNGTATVTISGGTAPYTYEFEGFVPVTEIEETTCTISGLPSEGSHRTRVMDTNGCSTDYQYFTVDGFPAPLLTADQNKLANCDDRANGVIFVHAEADDGGSKVFKFKLGDDGDFQDSPYFTGLLAGDYKVVVEDGHQCQAEKIIYVRYANSPVVMATGEIVCYNKEGSIHADIDVETDLDDTEGYVQLYQLFFKNGEKRTDPQTSNIFTELTAGVYTVKATDSYGCVGEGDAEIAAPSSPLGLLLKDSKQPSDNTKGSITVTTSGGWGGYTIVCRESLYQKEIATITNMEPGDFSFSNLDAGRYQVTITDKEGCIGAHLDIPLGNITSEPDLKASVVSVYPNPSGDGHFFIEWNSTENRKVTLEIYNMIGQLLCKTNVSTGARTSFDISELSSGTYLLRVPELNIKKKIVIQ